MIKTFKWTGKKGNTIEIEAESITDVRNMDMTIDGYEIKSDKQELYSISDLVVKIDGEVIDNCKDINFWKIIDCQHNEIKAKRIWGIERLAFTEEIGIKIQAFLDEVIELGKTKLAVEFIEIETNKSNSIKIEKALKIIEKAEKQKNIPSYNEARQLEKDYNDRFNEGGYGYIPHIIDTNEYNEALATIQTLMPVTHKITSK